MTDHYWNYAVVPRRLDIAGETLPVLGGRFTEILRSILFKGLVC